MIIMWKKKENKKGMELILIIIQEFSNRKRNLRDNIHKRINIPSDARYQSLRIMKKSQILHKKKLSMLVVIKRKPKKKSICLLLSL